MSKKLIKQDFFDTKIFEVSSITELPEIRRTQVIHAITLATHYNLGLTQIEQLRAKIRELPNMPKNELLTTCAGIDMQLNLLSDVEMLFDPMATACAFFFYLEDEEEEPKDWQVEKKKELFLQSGGAVVFFIGRLLKACNDFTDTFSKSDLNNKLKKQQVLKNSGLFQKLSNISGLSFQMP